MRKEREEGANSCLALVTQQLSTELDVPLIVTSQQCLQQQSSLLGRFELPSEPHAHDLRMTHVSHYTGGGATVRVARRKLTSLT